MFELPVCTTVLQFTPVESQRENWYVWVSPETPSQSDAGESAVIVAVSCGAPLSAGTPVESGASAFVCVESADVVAAEPFFDAETASRRAWPTSAAPAVYELPVASEIGEQLPPFAVQRFHWYVNVRPVAPSQPPVTAVNVWPSPWTVGSVMLGGPVFSGCTGTVWLLVTVVAPAPAEAVTATWICVPTSVGFST